MADIFVAIVLGIIEGFTEFLPISSTGHLILAEHFVKFTGEFANTFTVFIQLGAILAVVVYFRKKILPFGKENAAFSIWKKAAIATVPALIIGALVGKKLEAFLFTPIVVASALLVGGIVLILVERRESSPSILSVSSLPYLTVVLIGLAQCLAFIPGVSRSAATIIAGLIMGSSRMAAAEFSFLLAVPTLAAASAYSIISSGISFTSEQIIFLGAGFLTTFIVAWISIAALMKFISTRSFKVFGWYRIVLALVVLSFISLLGI